MLKENALEVYCKYDVCNSGILNKYWDTEGTFQCYNIDFNTDTHCAIILYNCGIIPIPVFTMVTTAY